MSNNYLYNQDDFSFTKEFKEYKILSKDEQLKLVIKAKNHDIEARNQLILSNSKLIIEVAKKYMLSSIPLSDLFEVGVLGIAHAIELYDETKGKAFSSYAMLWINQEIGRYTEYQSRTMRIPSHLNSVFIIVKKIKYLYYKQHGTYPTDEYLIEQYNKTNYNYKIDMDMYQKLKLYSSAMKSLDEIISKDDQNSEILENIIANDDMLVEDEVIMKEDSEFLRGILEGNIKSGLTDNERFVLWHYFGFDDNPKTFQEIGKLLHISKQAAHISFKKAIKKLSKNQELQENFYERKRTTYDYRSLSNISRNR